MAAFLFLLTLRERPLWPVPRLSRDSAQDCAREDSTRELKALPRTDGRHPPCFAHVPDSSPHNLNSGWKISTEANSL